MSIKLIAFDLDGTFLDDQKRCPAENIEAVRAAADRGVLIVPCTGRLYSGMPEEIRRLEFIRYVIAINGADVCDCQERKTIYHADLPLETAEELFDYADTLPVIYDCYQDGQGWIDRIQYGKVGEMIDDEALSRLVRRVCQPVDDFRRVIHERNRPVQKVQMIFRDQSRRLEELAKMSELFPDLAVTSSLYNNIEINAKEANKGAGLKALCGWLGLELSETMALGDGGNDITMIQAAGLGIAMGNADARVKACADAVVGTNEQAGVAQAIRRFVL